MVGAIATVGPAHNCFAQRGAGGALVSHDAPVITDVLSRVRVAWQRQPRGCGRRLDQRDSLKRLTAQRLANQRQDSQMYVFSV